MRSENGLLLHCFKDGKARFNGYLDDYASLIDGLTRLYEVSGVPRWIKAALELAGIMIDEFTDPAGGFFFTGKSHETLITRPKDVYDNATPSGNAMAATALLRLAELTGREDLKEKGLETLHILQTVMDKVPSAAGQGLIALSREILPPWPEFVIVSGSDPTEFREAIEAVYSRFLPGRVVAPATAEQAFETTSVVPLLSNRVAKEGRTTTYLCERMTCQAPVLGVDAIETLLDGLRTTRDPRL